MPSTTSPCPCCCPGKICHTLWQCVYDCSGMSFGPVTAVGNQCLPKGSAHDWVLTAGDSTSCTYQKLVATATCCTSDGECANSAAPAPPASHADCPCCAKVCYSLWQCIFDCPSQAFGDVTLVQNLCDAPGMGLDWTKTAGDTGSCTYQKKVETMSCCSSVGDCTATAAPDPPASHDDCSCCACNDDSLGPCDGCDSGNLPATILVSFSGGSGMTACFTCPGPGLTSVKITAPLSGMTFTLTHTGACRWTYTNASGPITVEQWVTSATCAGAPDNTFSDISITLGQGHGRGMIVTVGSYLLFLGNLSVEGNYDCCQPGTLVDGNGALSCDNIVWFGSTATLTPCPA